jgi:predicted transcriptional regulator
VWQFAEREREPDHAALAVVRRQDYIAPMDTAPRHGGRADTRSPETEAERQRRLAWEAEMIAEADAEIEAGLYVDADEVDAWIDSIGTDHELPPPPTRHR